METKGSYVLMGPTKQESSIAKMVTLLATVVGIVAVGIAVAALVKANDVQDRVDTLETQRAAIATQAAVQSHVQRVQSVFSSHPYCSHEENWAACVKAMEAAEHVSVSFHNATGTALTAGVSAMVSQATVVVGDRSGMVRASVGSNAPSVGQTHVLADPTMCTVHYGEHICGTTIDGKPVVFMGNLRTQQRRKRCFCIIGNCCNSGGDNTALNGDSVSVSP